MAGFRKAEPKQAALKIGIYGPPGSGKTFTSLLLAEGLGKVTARRVAYVDSERGTDFYCQTIKDRRVHPDAFDFDAIYTRSMMEVLGAVRDLDAKQYGVVVIDSITHIWEACIAAYTGNKASGGQIPFHAWGRIKAPYKQLMNLLLNSPLHVIICGRQGIEYGETENGETKAIGLKMKAEGETPYEPHILIRTEAIRQGAKGEAVITAFFEKDRTGILAQKVIAWPNFDNVCKPLLGLLGGSQAQLEDSDTTAQHDADMQSNAEAAKTEASKKTLEKFLGRMLLAANKEEVEAIGKEITPKVKAGMTSTDVDRLRNAFSEARGKKASRNGPEREAGVEEPEYVE